jgi:hypothetical protein
MSKPKLKPVVFVQGRYAYNRQNTVQQIMLLKALKVTQDPKKLRDLIGVKTVAEVHRTLDKIAMRKEYHSALAENGITFDYIVSSIKEEIDGAEKSSDRLAGLKMLLQSVGMDKYAETIIGGGGWEDIVNKINEETVKKDEKDKAKIVEYEVVEPEIPESVKKAKKQALVESSEIYD